MHNHGMERFTMLIVWRTFLVCVCSGRTFARADVHLGCVSYVCVCVCAGAICLCVCVYVCVCLCVFVSAHMCVGLFWGGVSHSESPVWQVSLGGVQPRCGPGVGLMWARCGPDMGQMWA